MPQHEIYGVADAAVKHYIASSNGYFINDASVSNPATDIFAITGSASKTILVYGVEVTMSAPNNTGTFEELYLVRRSSLGTGGTAFTDFHVLNLDRVPGVATATVRGWLVSPTALGTLLGVVTQKPIASTATDKPSETQVLLETPFRGSATPGVPLIGSSDTLAVRVGRIGRSVPAGGYPFSINVHWVEF